MQTNNFMRDIGKYIEKPKKIALKPVMQRP